MQNTILMPFLTKKISCLNKFFRLLLHYIYNKTKMKQNIPWHKNGFVISYKRYNKGCDKDSSRYAKQKRAGEGVSPAWSTLRWISLSSCGLNWVSFDGCPPLKGTHIEVCWIGGCESSSSCFSRDGGFVLSIILSHKKELS